MENGYLWLAWGIGLFGASGVIRVLVLVPVQARLASRPGGYLAERRRA